MAPLKVMAADKEAVEKEQAIKYAELQEKHQEALDMVEELKTEIAKAQAANTEASSPRSNTPIIRRKSGHNFMIIDRAHRSFASLRKIAAENFEGQPDVLQNFDLNLNSAMHELHARSQRIQELEADVATAKREMEAKMTIISGLTRERASLKASSMDMATISNLREQLEEKETQVKQMREDHAAREKELESQIEALLESVEQKSTKDERSQHAMEPEAAPSQQQEMHGERVANLEAELAAWEGKHREALEDMQSTEQQMRNTVLELESQVASYQEQLKAAQGGQAKTDEEMSEGAEAETKHNELVGFLRTEIDEYKAIINKNAARVAEAEEQHAAAKALLDTAARDRDAAAGEASAHKELAAKLEAQLAEHEQAIKAHHENMENLRSQHAKNIDDIQSSWRQDRDSKLTAVQAEHAEDIKACESALTEAREELMKVATQVAFALGLDVSVDKITQRIGDLIENQKALGQEQQKRSELEQHVAELTKVNDAVMRDLEAVKSGLTDILLTNGEMLQSPFLSVTEQLAMVQKKLADLETRNKTNSGLVEQLEDQLQNTFDLTQAANNRFSTLQSERNAALEEAIMAKTKLQAELETVREEHATLRTKYESMVSGADNQLANSVAGQLRKSGSVASLPSRPPACPLPPLPSSGGLSTSPTPRPPSKDVMLSHQQQDQEARIATITKHLEAEKQLTATLEEALTDLEGQQKRIKADTEAWRQRARELEAEVKQLKEKPAPDNRWSLQQVEEERRKRRDAELANARLEERMNSLNKQKKKKGSLNCF
ncbi:hypothetical protein P8C59_006345 [Phyllachora maydis]|uniref:Uncharacterized protein n=1 Tax=Phyllachora maydis TaxID=1825666 RepID=A0AAD9I7E6_9PEZI|nr:hypothetical protein P8C59_006345 [Phyllachora maydis]